MTSWKQLRDDAVATERWNRMHPAGPRHSSHLDRALGDVRVPVVAVTDYVTALTDQIARFVGAPFRALGTDGYGFSDTREALRMHFGIDPAGISIAALALLAENGLVDPEVVERALADTGVHDIEGEASGQDKQRAHLRVA